MRNNIKSVKQGQVIKCADVTDAVLTAGFIKDQYRYMTKLIFNYQGVPGIYLEVEKMGIYVLRGISAKIRQSKIKAVKLSKKILQKGFEVLMEAADHIYYLFEGEDGEGN